MGDVSRLPELPFPTNPFPENTPAGRAWFKGLNAGTAYEAPKIVNMALDHAEALATARARIAELEARLASLTSVSEDDVERVAEAMFVSGRKGIPWAKVPSTLRTTWLEYARAALTAFVSR